MVYYEKDASESCEHGGRSERSASQELIAHGAAEEQAIVIFFSGKLRRCVRARARARVCVCVCVCEREICRRLVRSLHNQ